MAPVSSRSKCSLAVGAGGLAIFLLFYAVYMSSLILIWRQDTIALPEFRSNEPPTLSEASNSLEDWPGNQTMHDIIYALDVLQSEFFEPWQGTWPSAIDWTAAVVGTQVSGALKAITRHPSYIPYDSPFGSVSTNTISGYFTHLTSFYFGENAFSLRNQAYDDMQWVVLNWIEAIKFTRLHSDLHFLDGDHNSSWHGRNYISAFAHRARIFWELASKGWDTKLCGGGMLWSPYAVPYKNAITNELYIATSVSMYLYFPGDEINFPFSVDEAKARIHREESSFKKHDVKYLNAAIEAYNWLMKSNMTNAKGLFTDGFHIAGWRGGNNGSNGTGKCDVRNDMVYTYNQGVLLTGQRGLWEATGTQRYLEDGHKLVRDVISATGYHLVSTRDKDQWAGLGRNGVLEEACDSSSSCSQNGQTFKSILFHHLTTFCEPLPIGRSGPVFHRADKTLARMHRQSCLEYGPWIARNAKAALGTRDSEGKFGTWWTVGLGEYGNQGLGLTGPVPQTGTDYRNKGVPGTHEWLVSDEGNILPGTKQIRETGAFNSDDPNDRGRGRTVESQCGGLAVLGSLNKILELIRDSKAYEEL